VSYVPLCILEVVEGALSTRSTRGALCAVCARGFALYARGAGGRALYAVLYTGGHGGHPLCAEAAGGCASCARAIGLIV
jgi:hypothetical protein